MSDDKDWWSKAPIDRLRIRAAEDTDIRLLVLAYDERGDKLARLSKPAPTPEPVREGGMEWMHVGRISNATRSLGAPIDWDKDASGPCSGLPIRDDETSAGPGMTSAWFPTPEEIERMQNGAPIYLTVLGRVHPPVSMSVGREGGTK